MVTDWNDKAVAFAVSRDMGPPPAERIMAMAHLAMFDAVNSIERKYRPYLVQLTVTQPPRKKPPRRQRREPCSPVSIRVVRPR